MIRAVKNNLLWHNITWWLLFTEKSDINQKFLLSVHLVCDIQPSNPRFHSAISSIATCSSAEDQNISQGVWTDGMKQKAWYLTLPQREEVLSSVSRQRAQHRYKFTGLTQDTGGGEKNTLHDASIWGRKGNRVDLKIWNWCFSSFPLKIKRSFFELVHL